MNKYQEFIKETLSCFPSYDLSKDDKKAIEREGLSVWITNKLVRSQFRRATLKENTKAFILGQVEKSVKENKPIYIIACFGGYKHFWNSYHPEVEWAELFNFRSMSEYLAPIAAAYEPGVILEYESEDVIISPMDNYPEEAMEDYAKSYRKLIDIYAKCLPKNFILRLIRATEQYDKEKLFKRIDDLLPAKKKKWEKLSKKEIEERTHRTDKNIMWKGKEDWTKLNLKEKEEKILESKVLNDTFYDADFELRPDYFEGENHIPMVFTFGLGYENVGDWLILASASSSFVDFWAGRGILEDRGEKIIPRIVSQGQYNNIKNSLKVEKIGILPLRNFETIEVYKGTLKF